MNKERIKKLILKYEKLSDSEKKKYNEQQTKDHFIRPLFEALGWNFEEDVWPETEVSRKRVDYAFKIDGVTKFYVEAKALAINLDEERWAEQAINYSWHKSVPWVILTDFEGIKIFNTEWDVPDIQSCKFIEISYREYLTGDKIHWLSHDSFIEGILDKKADEIGRKPKRIIDEQLADDLVRWRETLYKDLKAYNSRTINDKKILETVQTILNRLIFIRTLEDRNIEDIVLQPLVRDWEEKKGIKANDLLHSLNKVFRKIGKDYDSGLFEKDICDFLGEKIDADDNTFVEIIDELYLTKSKKIRYSFADIPADIFGNIYEQYLGHIQKEDGADKKTGKRKSQGIYYTPRYIVDYIVENTIGEILKNKTESEINNLKVLDPACGSGSFLNRAYQKLIDYCQNRKLKRVSEKCDKLKKFSETYNKKHGSPLSSAEKMRILRNNIFGVDLDLEAVELARLNLLLRMVSERIKLPNLINNIQEGNSLISGSEKELKKYFGKSWQGKKSFNWEEKFPEVFNQGGFDVIIGNPPYISFYSRESLLDKYKFDLEWLIAHYEFTKKYSDRRLNTVMFFLEKGLDLLKQGGYLGFIIDANFLEKPFRAIRKFIEQKNFDIIISNKINVFEGVGSNQNILFLKKTAGLKNKNPIKIIKLKDNKFLDSGIILEREEFCKDTVNLNTRDISLNCEKKLSDVADISTGVQIGIGGERIYNGKKIASLFYSNNKLPGFFENISLTPKNFFKYSPIKIKNYINLDEKLAYTINKNVRKCNIAVAKADDYKNSEKIFIRQSSNQITATLGYENQVSEYSAFMLKAKNISDIEYLLAILNSKLISFYSLQENIILTGSKKQPQIRIKGLKSVPIPNVADKEKRFLKNLVNKILSLNEQLQNILENYDKLNLIKAEIEKTDKIIDQKIYELYGLTEEEIKIIEGG